VAFVIAMAQGGDDDVLQAALKHAAYFDHRLAAARVRHG